MTDSLAIEELPSPNCDDRPAGQAVDMLILHYTGMPDAGQALRRLRDPQAKVSAHYVVDEAGKIYRMVPEERRAWHAGISAWKGARDINARSIGIEIVNTGHEFGYRPFQLDQMDALVVLIKDIKTRHDSPLDRVLGHSDVAPLRKQDPGELFDWHRLSVEGVAVWPTPRLVEWSDEQFYRALAEFGYDLSGPPKANIDPQVARRAACVAFCRHFRPAILRPVPDPEMKIILAGLVDNQPAQS
jgi:N-acetylmuramoyl-L-alanine amidase